MFSNPDQTGGWTRLNHEPDNNPGWFNLKTQLMLNRLKTHIKPSKTTETGDPLDRSNPSSHINQNFVNKIITFSF